MTASDAATKWKSFLESTPPNTSTTIPGLVSNSSPRGTSATKGIRNPIISSYCERDDGHRRFDPTNHHLYSVDQVFYHFIEYRCRDCGTTEKTIAVMIRCLRDEDFSMTADVEVMKLGEYPPFSAPISSRIEKLLSRSDLDLYRKGVRAEAQGLGIGAATYFRRIVEGQWQRLVKGIQQAAKRLGVEDLGAYDAALKEKRFSRAVERLKDAIPEKLRILDRQNPLTLLHTPLSQQLHGLTDEECLQQAKDIRVVLTVMLENIADVLKDQDELKEAAKRLRANPPSKTT